MEILPLSDCEPIHDGLVLQPMNAATALAYVVAGAWLLWRLRDAASPWLLRVYAGAITVVGVGSVLFHGVGGLAAQRVHDAGLVLLAGTLAGTAVDVWRHSAGAPGAAFWGGVGGFVAAIPFQVLGRTDGPLCAAGSIPSHAIWHVLTALALAAVGVAAYRIRVEGGRRRVRP